MNNRQKKKQYKKRYGYNPPRGADGRYLFHTTYGLDLAAGRDYSESITPEQMEMLMKIQELKQEDVMIAYYKAAEIVAQSIADFAADVSRVFSNVAKKLNQQVVMDRHLEEREKTCSRKEWKVSKK